MNDAVLSCLVSGGMTGLVTIVALVLTIRFRERARRLERRKLGFAN